jgi:predicted CoA-binding protein
LIQVNLGTLQIYPGEQMNSISDQIEKFLSSPAFAVFGASDDRNKYGHKVYACYLQHQRKAFPINPKSTTVLGNQAYASLKQLPSKVESISIITPPAVTEKIVEDAIEYGIKSIWMQPGAESAQAVEKAEQAGINVIHGGPCLLVVMGYHEPMHASTDR